MKRLFFLVPTIKIARDISMELGQVGISEGKIHIVGGAPDIYYEKHLHMASITQTSDLLPALRRGALMGIVLSVVIFLLFYFALPSNIQIHPIALVAMLFFGIGFGLWASGMVGIGIKNPIVEKYEDYVKEGHLIMMVDSPDEREQELTTRIIRHHPGAEIATKPVH
jgi:hypothetical protein